MYINPVYDLHQPPSARLSDCAAHIFCAFPRRGNRWFWGLSVTGGKSQRYQIEKGKKGGRSGLLGKPVCLQEQQRCWGEWFIDSSCPKHLLVASQEGEPGFPWHLKPCKSFLALCSAAFRKCWDKVSKATRGYPGVPLGLAAVSDLQSHGKPPAETLRSLLGLC